MDSIINTENESSQELDHQQGLGVVLVPFTKLAIATL